MIITEKTVYVIDGIQFDSIERAEQHEADVIGRLIIDPLLQGVPFSPRDKIKLLENLLRMRTTIVKLLAQ